MCLSEQLCRTKDQRKEVFVLAFEKAQGRADAVKLFRPIIAP